MRTGNKYRSVWTTSADATKASVFEHHEYMVFRYAEIVLGSASAAGVRAEVAAAPLLSAWTVRYPWFDGDSDFTSSDAVLRCVM